MAEKEYDVTILIEKMFKEIERHPKDTILYHDLFSVLVNIEKKDFKYAHEQNKRLAEKIRDARKFGVVLDVFYKMWCDCLLFDAPYDFDSFLIYIEKDREPEDQFYLPRRRQLKKIVEKLQALADDELDELFIAQPPRTGKTTLAVMFCAWVMGRSTEHPNLYCSYSDTITRSFYNGVLEILTDVDTYKYKDVFPKAEIVRTNAQEETIDLERKKRYPSLVARSLNGTLNGACDAEKGFIISDDLISGIEEAMNKDRLMSAWVKVDNNLIPRGKGGTKYLWIGTRWSVYDPAGIRINLLESDEKFKDYRWDVINVPALDENDKSNFNYLYGVGFNDLYYQQRRASFERNNDIASWEAQYMGTPIEREGTLFSPDGFNYYNGDLPNKQPDRIFCFCDPAFGGGDFTSAPICYQYDEDIYVPSVIFDNGDKSITQPKIANRVIKYNVGALRIEATKATETYKEGIESILKSKGYRLNIQTKAAPTNKSKEQRIFDKAPDIREHFYFLETNKRDKEYSDFMMNVFNFKMFGKNKHDDAPDSLAGASDMAFLNSGKVEIFKRLF